jgi:hypothetical protein
MTWHKATLADRRAERGYSLQNTAERQEWVAMLSTIEKWIAAEQLHEEIVFHGTSTTALANINSEGLLPDFRSDAIIDPTNGEFCTFWGDLDTACFYAEDTVAEKHPGSRPVILAISVDTLEQIAFLQPDGASIDFPIDGLAKVLEPGGANQWEYGTFDRPWKDGLRDYGAIVAVHDDPIDIGFMRSLRTIFDVEELEADKSPEISPAI